MEQSISQKNITIMHKLHYHLTKTKLIKETTTNHRPSSLATDPSSWHGNTHRGIDFLFFLASGVPRFGSTATAIPATEQTAAAAAANTKSLLPLLLSFFVSQLTTFTFSPSAPLAPFVMTSLRLVAATGERLARVDPPSKEDVMVIEAIFAM